MRKQYNKRTETFLKSTEEKRNIKVPYCTCRLGKAVEGDEKCYNRFNVTDCEDGETCDYCGFYVHWRTENTASLRLSDFVKDLEVSKHVEYDVSFPKRFKGLSGRF